MQVLNKDGTENICLYQLGNIDALVGAESHEKRFEND